MKVRKGFLLTYEKKLRRMIPFFVKVRSEDIVKTDPVDIGAILVPTSMRWEEARVEDNVDVTIYKYTAKWSNKTDPHNETIDPAQFEGDLIYKMYKDGRMEVSGCLKMERISTESSSGLLGYSVHLPFAFPEENPNILATWKYGDYPGLTMVTAVDSVPITNAELSTEYTESYPYHFTIWLAWTGNDADSEELFKNLAMKADPYFNGNETVDDYLEHFTFNINYSGWWRAEKLPNVVPAESYEQDYAGLYVTTGMVALLSAPSTTLGVTVRALAMGTIVRNHGYYTESDGSIWLLCTYQSTNEIGYIQRDLLITQ